MSTLFLEDFAVGQTFRTAVFRVTADDIQRFAREFDPQPFHLDETAARQSIFGGLAASGWHTAAVTMKLVVASELSPANGIIGMGFDELRWPRPVRPGDELHVVTAFGKQEVETVEIGRETYVISSADEATQLTEGVAAKLHLEHPELHIVTRGLEGKPATAIVDAAAEIDADLIVIGNKRVQGVGRVLGSIATAILHKAHCDVYVAHTHDH